MNSGVVRRNRDGLEPVLRLGLFNTDKQIQEFDFVVDTAFTGYLAVTHQMLREIGVLATGTQRAILADGQVGLCNVAVLTLNWDGAEMTVEAQIFDGDPLIGTRLLEGHEVRIDVKANGIVEITKLSRG